MCISRKIHKGLLSTANGQEVLGSKLVLNIEQDKIVVADILSKFFIVNLGDYRTILTYLLTMLDSNHFDRCDSHKIMVYAHGSNILPRRNVPN